MIRALRQLVVTWGALVLPLFVCAHNGEFLLAKLTLRTDGSCVLRVTVDTEANFNLQDRAQLPGEFAVVAGVEHEAWRGQRLVPSRTSFALRVVRNTFAATGDRWRQRTGVVFEDLDDDGVYITRRHSRREPARVGLGGIVWCDGGLVSAGGAR